MTPASAPPPFPRLLVAALACATAAAAQAQQVAARSIADLSLEQLSSIEVVTSVGKRLQRLADVPGSVYVIRAEDIRRAGATTLPEALRLAPNLQVARVDASQYAISARSGADILANKMLVLVDGRTVYSPLFSGVFWEAMDVLMEDIERIEVLSGAGGTLYGSNAFHGVINVITRSAADTHGALASVVAGSRQRMAAARFGAEAQDWHYRLYAKRTLQDATSRAATGAGAGDAMARSQAGFRADRPDGDRQFTVQGDVFTQRSQEPGRWRDYSGGNLLARYVVPQGEGGRLQVQAYVDRFERDRLGATRNVLDTLDLELQQQSRPRAGHDLLWGAGWREQHDSASSYNPAALALLPAERRLRLWNVFLQDEVSVAPGLLATAGLKAEHNSYTGLELLPNLRLAWEHADGQLLWAGASRVVRTPARVDRDTASPPLTLSPGFEAEVARIFELGWRRQAAAGVSYSATLFHHRFQRLRSFDLTPAGTGSFGNNYRGSLSGVEAWADWQPRTDWRLQGGWLWQRPRYSAEPGTAPLPPAGTLGNDARHRLTLASSWTLRQGLEMDLRLRREGERPSPQVPAYTGLDARIGWRLNHELELALNFTNLARRRHVEWGAPATRAEFGRGVFLQATWRQ